MPMRICQHANISWRMLFSCGSLPQPGVLDSAANYLHPIQFSLQHFLLGRHTSRLDLDPRPTYTTAILGPIKINPTYCGR
jgi:hypothetical protein